MNSHSWVAASLGSTRCSLALRAASLWVGESAVAKTVENVRHNKDVLKPLLTMMATHRDVVPCVSDQGPKNLAALNYIQYSDAALVHCQFDSFHRAWNDIKLAARRAKAYP